MKRFHDNKEFAPYKHLSHSVVSVDILDHFEHVEGLFVIDRIISTTNYYARATQCWVVNVHLSNFTTNIGMTKPQNVTKYLK